MTKNTEAGTLQSRVDELEKALRRIANPIAELQREAEESGYKINGPMAVQLAGDANFLKEIAKEALAVSERLKNAE